MEFLEEEAILFKRRRIDEGNGLSTSSQSTNLSEIQDAIQLKCFLCRDIFPNLQALFDHVKQFHKIKDRKEFKCTLCYKAFQTFAAFKKNMERCLKDKQNSGEVFPHIREPELHEMLMEYQDERITKFSHGINKSALLMACTLSGNMNFARCATFNIINIVKTHIETITKGMKDVILPRLEGLDKDTVEDFILAIENSFIDVRSEYALDSTLIRNDLLIPFEKCEIITDDVSNDNENSDNEEQESGEGDSNDENSNKIENVSYALMPIAFQIKKFLELPKVLEKILNYTFNIQTEGKLNHFINGRLWKTKLKAYDDGENVIPLFFYFDGAQINNALGSHTKLGNEMFVYYSFPTIPPAYISRLENIFCASLHPEHFNKKYGNERLYNNLIDELNKFAEQGIVLNIDGKNTKVFFVVGLIIGDNKEVNNVLDFAKGFLANYPCRFCRIQKDIMQNRAKEDKELLRNRENYSDDVMTADFSKTGVHKEAVFNDLALFHVTESAGADTMHDLTEGMLHIHLSKCLLYFIEEKKSFTLKTLNERMRNLNYGDAEKGNVSCDITMKHLKNMHLQMSSSELFCFAEHLPFMIGDLVTHSDNVWQFYLVTMKVFNLCYLPSYTEGDLRELDWEIEKMIDVYILLFDLTLKPKHHFMTHYPTLTRDFGPLRYIQSIRFEAKHSENKSYAKNTNSRLNISYSIAKKVQYNFAARLIFWHGFVDRINVLKCRYTYIKNEKFDEDLSPSNNSDLIRQQKCYLTKKAIVNGIVFSTTLFLPYVEQLHPIVYEIIEIVLTSMDDTSKIFFVCKEHAGVVYDHNFGCYTINTNFPSNKLTVIRMTDFLLLHQYPIQLHNVNNEYKFKCKRF